MNGYNPVDKLVDTIEHQFIFVITYNIFHTIA